MTSLRAMAKTKKQRWCRCGHVDKNHYSIWYEGIEGVFRGHYENFQCHATFCNCRAFTLDTSLWSRVKRKLNAR